MFLTIVCSLLMLFSVYYVVGIALGAVVFWASDEPIMWKELLIYGFTWIRPFIGL